MGRPTKIEEFKNVLVRYSRELKHAGWSFSQLAVYLKMRGLDVDAKSVANWSYELDGVPFDGVTLEVVRGKWGRSRHESPHWTKVDVVIKTFGVQIEAPGCPDELLPARFPLPPVPIFLLKLPYQMQNLEAFEPGPEPDVATRARWLLRQLEIEKAEEEPLTTGDEGYVLRDRDAVHPSGYQLRT